MAAFVEDLAFVDSHELVHDCDDSESSEEDEVVGIGAETVEERYSQGVGCFDCPPEHCNEYCWEQYPEGLDQEYFCSESHHFSSQ